ncbi:AraC family transcriptional regulator [Pantoea wallisii]|nr:AraC family transcriptional regulator [Pantoea wallisii]
MLIHPSDNIPFSGDARRDALRHRLMAPDAPKVIAVALSKELNGERRTHRHAAGQLYCLKQGLMTVNTPSGIFANPPRLVGWIPPWFEHAIVGPGRVLGWTVLIDEALAAPLPDRPVLLSCPDVLEPLAERLATLDPDCWSSERYHRLGQVFLDELYESTQQALTLPLPEEPRLRQIACLLMDDPSDARTGPELARWAGLSPRSLSRHWSIATGMSLSKYRQMSRLLKSLEALAAGKSVQQVAWQVGFDSVSSYISAFRAAFGSTPGKYFTVTADAADAVAADSPGHQ